MTRGIEVFENWFQQVWNSNDKEISKRAIDEMFPSGVADGLGENDLEKPEDFLAFRNALSDQIEDIHISIERSVDDGEWTALLCRLKGTCRESGKPVSITGTVMGKVVDGKIICAHNHWDFMSMWSEIGVLPKDCFSQCLQGNELSL